MITIQHICIYLLIYIDIFTDLMNYCWFPVDVLILWWCEG